MAFLSAASAFGQATCTVEESRKLWTVTAHFLAPPLTVNITLPSALNLEPAKVYLEVANSGTTALSRQLFMETGGERVAIENGAAIHVTPTARGGLRERLAFSLSNEAGQTLCTWMPLIRVSKRLPRQQLEDGFTSSSLRFPGAAVDRIYRGVSAPWFINVGDPISLGVNGKLAREPGEYRIDGLPATLLAWTPGGVVLRDPRPTAGLRTVESQGYTVKLACVEVQLQLPKPSLHRSGTMNIKVLGVEVAKPPAALMLFNLRPETIKLLCGKSRRFDYDANVIELKHEGAGVFTADCKVSFLQDGRVDLDQIVIGRFVPSIHFPFGLSFPPPRRDAGT